MIQLHTPEGIKEISDEEALKLGIEIPINIKEEIEKLKIRLVKLERIKPLNIQ